MKTAKHSPDQELHDRVLDAIRGALREEKEPWTRRAFKIFAATLGATVLFGFPFWISFRSEMSGVWIAALSLWVLYFLVGFTLYFKPQPRLMVSGLFGPFVIAKLFLASTLATIAQILICPSFVFLTSSFEWNPLLGLTEFLMARGGMNLCMGFCGFLFSSVSAGIGIRSIRKAAKARDMKSNAIILSVLLVSQAPVFLVQVLNEDLRPFVAYWIFGVLGGFILVLGLKWAWDHLFMKKTKLHLNENPM
jgi:hypothetical protein